MRFGRSVARRVMLYRLGGMMESWRRRGVEYILILVPGYTEMRLVETWLRNSAWGVRAFCAVEADALSATDSDGLMLTRAARRGTYGVSFSRLLESVGERDNEEYRELEAFEARQALRCRRTDGYSAGVRTTGLLRRCRD